MNSHTYGVIKWLQQRGYSQTDIITTIYRYGAVNRLKEEENIDYKDVVCSFIQSQDEGFQFFTSWVKVRESQPKRRKRREAK